MALQTLEFRSLLHTTRPELWDAILAAGVAPAGLGARDTLRLEAGLPLHGQELGQGRQAALGRRRAEAGSVDLLELGLDLGEARGGGEATPSWA